MGTHYFSASPAISSWIFLPRRFLGTLCDPAVQIVSGAQSHTIFNPAPPGAPAVS